MSSPTPNILQVNASGRKNGSVSRELSAALINALREDGADPVVTERELSNGMPFVDEAWIAANFTAPEDRSAEQSAVLSFSDTLVEELKDADLIVIGAPIYNFGIPAALKAWIDQIARARLTFRYSQDGPVGLLENKRAVIVTASGGVKAGSEIDFATGYLRHVLGFVGIRDVTLIAADGLTADADAPIAQARGDIEAFAADFRARNELAA